MVKKKSSEGNRKRKLSPIRSLVKSGGGRKIYAVGAVGLALLLLFSFFVPQLIFRLGDIYLCRDFVHEEQEDVDVTLLGATYEFSLGKRLKNFVVGQERGRDFYVSVQEMTDTQELYQQLNRDGKDIMQQNLLNILAEARLLNPDFYDVISVERWKQYVIYSDDYTEGVNFIIWYLDIQDAKGDRLELLMDAEDYTIYGVYAERNTLLNMGTYKNLTLYFQNAGIDLDEWWVFTHFYYQLIDDEDLYNYYVTNSSQLKEKGESNNDENETVTLEQLESAWNNGEAMIINDNKSIVWHLLVAGQMLDFSVRIFEEDLNIESTFYLYPEVYLGIDAICQLIPEFNERL